MKEIQELVKTVDVHAGNSYRIEIFLCNGEYESKTYLIPNFSKVAGLSHDCRILEWSRSHDKITGDSLESVVQKSVDQIDDFPESTP